MSDYYPQGDPQLSPPPAANSSNGLAIAALVCGIVGLFIFEIVLGPLAIIFGGLGLRNASRGASRRGFALAGLIIGIIDVLVFILFLAIASSHNFSWHSG
ncbi:MAG TPA: DUF4190 domain-containing protein [Streptosporangiaceae bacterium]|jgi:hypothetical protein